MALLPAIGLGVAIIVLRVLAPEIWSALQHTIVSTLSVGSEVITHLHAAAVMSLPAPTF